MKIKLPEMYRCYRILGWDFTITPARLVLLALVAFMGCVAVTRLLTGFQYVTHLTDETPWGLWISFDVLCGVALAGGGYSTALLVGGFKYQKYGVVARSALLTSLLGYLLVMAGLFLDIGLWPHFWRPFVSWGYTSVLFEVFWCISIYTTILTLEFHEIITERMFKFLHPYVLKALPFLVIIGLIFPMMHQSSLGGLFLIAKSKMFPLWWSPLLPLYFLISSFFVGSAMVYVESDLARRNYAHTIDQNIMLQLTRVGGRIMIVYLILKIIDLTRQGQWGLVFQGSMQSNLQSARAPEIRPARLLVARGARRRAQPHELRVHGNVQVGRLFPIGVRVRCEHRARLRRLSRLRAHRGELQCARLAPRNAASYLT